MTTDPNGSPIDAPFDTRIDAPFDPLSIRTPELVDLQFPLAGIGSRFVAVLLDYLLQLVAFFVLVLLFVVILSAAPSVTRSLNHSSNIPSTPTSDKWAMAIAIAIPFFFEWGYFALFEAFWRGQTPGKRIMKIRVIQQTGRSISLFESLARNLVRMIDLLPSFYILGVITMFVTRRQQRLGDLVAGTLVVHEREIETPFYSVGNISNVGVTRTFTAASFETVSAPAPRISRLPADAVATLSLTDLQALESYLNRRFDISVETRALLSDRLAQDLTRKMNLEIPEGMSRESFLEEVAFSLRSLPHLR